MKSYLIQRCNVNLYNQDGTKNNFNDINDLLNYDYMGSAEFEFGALPKSYKRIRFNFNKYKVFNTGLKNYNGVPCYVLCKENIKDEVIDNIKELAKGEQRLKEYITFEHHITKSKSSWSKPKENFWWDIGHDFMFWFGQDKNDVITEIIKNDSIEFTNSLSEYKIKYRDNTEEIAKGEEINYYIRIYKEDGTITEVSKDMAKLI